MASCSFKLPLEGDHLIFSKGVGLEDVYGPGCGPVFLFLYKYNTYNRIYHDIFRAKFGPAFFLYIKVCFLVSDNGFSQIFCICFHQDEIF